MRHTPLPSSSRCLPAGRAKAEPGEAEPPEPPPQWALLVFDSPVVAPADALLIGARLDLDASSPACRLALHGRLAALFDGEASAGALRLFKRKLREGSVERWADERTAVCRGMFKKETDISLFEQMRVVTGAGQPGVIQGAFGKSGKYKVYFAGGVPAEQLWRAQGGEHFRLNDDVSVRVYPSLHSCIWSNNAPPGTVVTGDYGVFEDEREGRLARSRAARAASGNGLRPEWAYSDSTGGALDYLIDTPDGTILFQDSMGYWTGIYAGLRADLAILGASGRGNVDGEPFQGSTEQFILRECELIRPRQVLSGHHDNYAGAAGLPDLTDLGPVHAELARVMPRLEVLEVGLAGRITVLG